MTYDVIGAGALNYAPCRYGNSRVLYRGPERRLDVPYVAFIGGTDTYGKFINAPFPALVESDIGLNCVNFGIANAGLDVFLNDGFVMDAVNGSEKTVLQVLGAQNMSNRFYSVHPRRNDRFVKASPILSSIFPEVDFSEFHFTRHMLNALYQVSDERFSLVQNELQTAWSARMKLLLQRMDEGVVLLWFADHSPTEDNSQVVNPADCSDPMFVTRGMLDNLRAHVVDFVEVRASQDALNAGTEGMVFGEMETIAAGKIMGPRAHGEVALHLGRALHAIL
ncbi:MAG: DUF6473 family protein [Roseobacter sp.]